MICVFLATTKETLPCMFDPQPDWFPVLCPISCARVSKTTPTERHTLTFYGLQ